MFTICVFIYFIVLILTMLEVLFVIQMAYVKKENWLFPWFEKYVNWINGI